MAIAHDASTPVRWAKVMAATDTTTSASFTAPADSYITVDVETDGATGGSNPVGTISISDSSGLTWTEHVRRAEAETTDGGSCVMFGAPAVASTSRTITVSRAGGGANTKQFSCKARVWTGVDIGGTPVAAITASNEGGSGTNNLTTTSITASVAGVLICATCEWNQLGTFQASSDLTQDTADYSGAISVCSGYKAVSAGSVNGNMNAAGTGTAQHKWVQILLQEAGGGGGGTTPKDVFGKMFSGPFGGAV